MEKVLAIDVGGTSLKSALVDRNGNTSNEDKISIAKDYNSFISAFGTLLEHLPEKPIALSLALPGGYDIENDKIFAPNILYLTDKNIKKDLVKRYHLEVIAENDANLATYGEYCTFERDRGIKNMVLVTLGTGFGGGLILNGSLLQSNITLFEVGHISIDIFSGRSCGCGNRGCLDEYCSSSGIEAIYNRITNKSGKVSLTNLGNLAKKGDSATLETFKEYGVILANAFANISALFCPEKIKIGGGISNLAEYYLPTCIEKFNEILFPAYKNRVKIEIAELKNKAGIIGAGLYYFNNKAK